MKASTSARRQRVALNTLAWMLALAALLFGCFPRSGPLDITTNSGVQEPVGDAGLPKELGPVEANASAIIQARLGVGPSSGSTETVVDLEVQGLQTEATRVCEEVLQKEIVRLSAAEGLTTRTLRSCSREALPEPDSTTRYALVQIDHFDKLELLLLLPEQAKDKAQSLRVRRRILTGYKDIESCQATLSRLQEEQAKADKEAQERAEAYIKKALVDAQRAADEACKASPTGQTCQQEKRKVSLLKEREGRDSTEPQAPTLRHSALCRPR